MCICMYVCVHICTCICIYLFSKFRGSSLRRVKNGNKWRAKEINLEQKTNVSSNALNRLSANLSTTELSPALIAQANWTFVERLLKVNRISIFFPNLK